MEPRDQTQRGSNVSLPSVYAFNLIFESPANSVRLLSQDTHTCCDSHTETHALRAQKQMKQKRHETTGEECVG